MAVVEARVLEGSYELSTEVNGRSHWSMTTGNTHLFHERGEWCFRPEVHMELLPRRPDPSSADPPPRPTLVRSKSQAEAPIASTKSDDDAPPASSEWAITSAGDVAVRLSVSSVSQTEPAA